MSKVLSYLVIIQEQGTREDHLKEIRMWHQIAGVVRCLSPSSESIV